MGFEAKRLDGTPPSKYKNNRKPDLSLELLPNNKSGAEEKPAEAARKEGQ